MRKALYSRLKWGGYDLVDGKPVITDASMRKAVRTYSGVQRVSNFRPSAAKAIYNYFDDVETVWDMSSGFGGRLFGFLSSNAKTYIGTDPATQTFQGLLEIKNEWEKSCRKNIELHQTGSETFTPDRNSLDLCFTSPPYFSREQYSHDKGQSFLKFDSVNDWNEGFLKTTLSNCLVGLKPGAVLMLNVANVKEHKTLVDDSKRIALEVGFEYERTLQYALSSIAKGGFKYEPILMFRKPK